MQLDACRGKRIVALFQDGIVQVRQTQQRGLTSAVGMEEFPVAHGERLTEPGRIACGEETITIRVVRGRSK
jgi:hypothetical protein